MPDSFMSSSQYCVSAAFQKKCLGKMEDVTREGRTVLFVSHNIAAVQGLCDRGIFLKDGAISSHGTVDDAVAAYLMALERNEPENLLERKDRKGKGAVRLTSVEVSQGPDSNLNILATGCPARFVFRLSRVLPHMACVFTVYSQIGQPVASFDSSLDGPTDSYDPAIGRQFVCDLDELSLVAGRYRLNVAIRADGELQDHVEAAVFVNVDQGQMRGRPVVDGNEYGSVRIPHRWTLPIGPRQG